MSGKDIYLLKNELEALRSVDHPNIVKLYETYEDENYFHIVMEYCEGGDLLSKFIQTRKIDEKRSAHIIYQVLSAVNHLHKNGIVHRDIKAENIMFRSSKEEDWEIKVIDFGISAKLNSNFTKMHNIVGSPFSIAPEIFSEEYDHKCDMWSVGVLTYFLLSGTVPFTGNSHHEVID